MNGHHFTWSWIKDSETSERRIDTPCGSHILLEKHTTSSLQLCKDRPLPVNTPACADLARPCLSVPLQVLDEGVEALAILARLLCAELFLAELLLQGANHLASQIAHERFQTSVSDVAF